MRQVFYLTVSAAVLCPVLVLIIPPGALWILPGLSEGLHHFPLDELSTLAHAQQDDGVIYRYGECSPSLRSRLEQL